MQVIRKQSFYIHTKCDVNVCLKIKMKFGSPNVNQCQKTKGQVENIDLRWHSWKILVEKWWL